ncbi:MAG: OFA family MFS transporter [Bryobacteraceae bacterium]
MRHRTRRGELREALSEHNTAMVMEHAAANEHRWKIPIAAVAVHVCIGSVYAWSTFNRPIQTLIPNSAPLLSPPYSTFSTALVLLGLSAAFGGPWVERRGPRAAARAAAMLFGSGLVIGGVGLLLHHAFLVFLGMGVIGGMGCGLGYISPVSTLVKWFPDHRGMATGMAIMGFGGGAFLAGYLNVYLMGLLGVETTLIALGVVYFGVMITGARVLHRPPAGWKPPKWNPALAAKVSVPSFTRNQAIRTVPFYLLWGMMFINITAGIGILAQASPMMQDMFQKTPVEAAAVVSIISIFNACGRFFWASCSDYLGRRNTYLIFFAAQVALFMGVREFNHSGEWVLFQAALYIIFTMYGGGFATIPAYLADLFGTDNVGAIHGAILTSWSAAAIAGPLIITELSQHGVSVGMTRNYDYPLQLLAGMLAVGFFLTLAVRQPERPAEP